MCTGAYTPLRSGNGIATDSAGSVLLTGHFQGSLNCGSDTPTLTGTGYADMLTAKFSSSGAPIWMKRYGGCSGCADIGSAITADTANNDVVATGTFQATVNAEGQTMTSAGGDDVMLARLRP